MRQILEKIYKGTRTDFFEEVQGKLSNDDKTVIVTANPEIMIHAEDESSLGHRLLEDDVLITADGIGVVKACKYILKRNVERIAGVETVDELLSFCEVEKKKVLVYGSKQSVLDLFSKVLNFKLPLLEYELINGYDYKEEYVLKSCQEFDADLILVCMGVPRQEKIIFNMIPKVNKGVFIGCGGSIDVLSGSKKRAPELVQKLNIEWLYRILKEPKRFNRFLKNQTKFVFKVIKEARIK